MRRFVSVLAALALFPLGAAAQTKIAPFSLPSARMAALGGPHAAAASGLDAIFENPAGFVSEKTEFSAASLVLNPSGPIFDIVGMLVSGGDPLADLTALFDDNGRLYMQTDILGPLAFGYAGKGLGFGLFNRTLMTLDASSLLSVRYAVSEEFLLAGGYAYRFTPERQADTRRWRNAQGLHPVHGGGQQITLRGSRPCFRPDGPARQSLHDDVGHRLGPWRHLVI
ncbi:MAG: hypothetical protein CVV51_12590 [Spirochaetae bacterium HGW-Spirochaetae-7]|nr:MAG: hypothetical protein CVV51_12590 [Spirochaetae bacterium HGW-Spirochaetae-7]